MSEGPTIRQRNPLVIALIIIVLVLAAVYVVTRYVNPKILSPTTTTQEPKLQVKTADVDNGKLPDGFPKDVPLEDGATILQNYNATTSGSGNTASTQATRTFESKKTLDENYALYTNFFKSPGWVVKTTFEDVHAKSVTAQKGTTEVTVHIDQNVVTNAVTVNVTAGQAPAIPATK